MAESKLVSKKIEWNDNLLAVVQIRGTTRTDIRIKDTLRFLGLNKKFSCVLVPNDPSYVGMIQKVKDFVTWGKIDKETFDLLMDKRFDGKKTLHLAPPRGGFERGGIKKPYSLGGVLGHRDDISPLIKKMI